MPNPKVILACTLDENDQLSIKLQNNLSPQDPQTQDNVKKWVGHAMEATYDILKELVSDKTGRILTAGQVWIASVGYDYLNNLEDERQKYGDDGIRDEAVAIAQTFAGVAASTATSATTTIFFKNPALGIGVGISTQEAYDRKFFDDDTKSAKDKLGDFVRNIIPNNSAKPQIAIESVDASDSLQTQTSIYKISNTASADGLLVGGAGSNILQGGHESNTYYLPTLSGSDIIDDIDSDGVIVIGNGSQSIKLSGNALPKTDESGNVIEGVWTLSGFDLHKSSSGNGLVICAAGADILSGATGRVLVQNFPFSNSRGGFGITLGKTKDLSTDANGNVISKIGYDSSTKSLPTQQYFYSRDFAKTNDDSGFFGFIAQASDTPNSLSTYKLRIGNFDHAGNKVGEQELSEFPITVASAIYFQKYQDSKTGEDAYLVPFESDYRDSSNIRQSKVGFCLLNKSGQKLSSQVVASNSGDNKLLFAANIATSPDQDYFYLAYVSLSNGLQSSFEQKISKSSLEKVGDPYLISGCCPHPGPSGSTVLQFSNGNVITISQSASALLSNSHLNLQLPKLRDMTPAEVISNQNLAAGTQVTDPSLKESILSFPPDASSNLQVSSNPNSVLALMGMDGNANAKMTLPVSDRSELAVYSTDSGEYSLEDLLAGKFDSSSATQVSPI